MRGYERLQSGVRNREERNVYSAVKTVTGASSLDHISGKVEGNESRGGGGGGEREQGSGKVVEEEEAKGKLACRFGNVIAVYRDLLWFLPARYPIPTTIIPTRSTGPDWV